MSKYKEIKGFKVQTLATDTTASQVLGGTWASGGNLPTALSSVRGLGPQTAAVAVGGTTAPGPANSATFHYDGSSWSTPPATLNTARGFANISKLGTQTAGIYFGGSPYLGSNESYNGTAWTEVNDLNTARQELGGSGTQAAALATGGRISSPAYVANNESWNGSSWTEVNDLNTARGSLDSTGTSTDSIAAGGTIAPASPVVGTNSETWDGTSWTTTTSFSTARRGNSMFGLTSTDALVTGGDTSGNPFPSQSLTGSTEYWNGSSWTELADLATGRANAGSSGSSTAGLIEGGYGPPSSVLTATEEWTAPSDFTQINLGQVYYNSTANAFKVTQTSAADGSWASITSGNTARRVASGVGTSVSNGMVIAGYPGENEVETWNGTSWTEVAEVNSARGSAGASSNSPNSSALFFGGDARPSNPATSALNESWNGSTWTEVGDLPAGLNGNGGAGVSNTSALSYGGSTPSATGVTNEWNGSSWTAGGSMNTARYYLTGTGTTTSALALGGFTSPPSVIRTNAEAYDGSSWTNLSATNSGHSFAGASGTTTEALLFGGEGPSYPGGAMTQTEYWDGTSWTEVADLSAGNLSPAGFGSSGVSAISSFGNNPGGLLATAEQFAAGTSNKTITVS